VGADYFGDFGRVDIGVQVAIHSHLPQFGDQPGVVLRGEECRVDPEDFGDPEQYGYRQGSDVVLDLVEVARRDFQHLGQRSLAESAFAAQLPNP
jgi:hypothetical protein